MTQRHQVVLFLLEVKRRGQKDFRFEERPQNMATLAKIGITKSDAKSRVMALTVEDFSAGPKVRDDGRGDQESWEFGIHVNGTLVYVKLSLPDNPERCVCVSFHVPEYPMTFPFRPSDL